MAGPPKCCVFVEELQQRQQRLCPALGEAPSPASPSEFRHSQGTGDGHRGQLGSHVESCSTLSLHAQKAQSSDLPSPTCVAKIFNQRSCRMQAVGTPGRKGRNVQPGGRLEHPLLCHLPATSPSCHGPAALCSQPVALSQQVSPKVTLVSCAGTRSTPKAHSWRSLSGGRRTFQSRWVLERCLVLGSVVGKEEKWSGHFPSPQTQLSKYESDKKEQILTCGSRKKSHNQRFSRISSIPVGLGKYIYKVAQPQVILSLNGRTGD